MREWQSQSHVRWYCKYHIVFVPKYRRRSIYGSLRRQIGGILRELCHQQGVELVEGHAMPDHTPLVPEHPAEVQRGEHCGVPEREVSDQEPSSVSWAEAQLHGPAFLGTRVLREHHRFGRGEDPRLHPRSGS